jgi:hypothetical protein
MKVWSVVSHYTGRISLKVFENRIRRRALGAKEGGNKNNKNCIM